MAIERVTTSVEINYFVDDVDVGDVDCGDDGGSALHVNAMSPTWR